MKKLFALMLSLAFAGTISAQTTAPAEKKEEKAAVKKDAKASEAGVKEEGVKEKKAPPAEKAADKEHHSKFECPKCHMTSEKPGKCGMCKVDMVEVKAEKKMEKAEMKEQKHEEHKAGDGHGHDKKADEKKAE